MLEAVSYPSVDGQGADEQHGHAGCGRDPHREPEVPGQDAGESGELGDADEPVARPGIPKWLAEASIIGWAVSFPRAGTRQAAASRSERATNTGDSFRWVWSRPLTDRLVPMIISYVMNHQVCSR